MSEATFQPPKQYVKYVPVGFANTHSCLLGYLFWIIGFSGAHRFYLGRPVSGAIWFFTFGLLGLGWLIDAFLIPSMVRENNRQFQMGAIDYNVAWVLLWLGGLLGLHRFYSGKILTGVLYLLTGGLFLVGWVYDLLTLNEQIHEMNCRSIERFGMSTQTFATGKAFC